MLTSSKLPVKQLLICCAIVVTLSMGIRHSFGLWLLPITSAHGWTREDYSLALAVQNLVWGAAGPLVGWWADRRGAYPVLWVGGFLYAMELAGMALSTHATLFMLSTGLLIGLAQACTTYSVLYGIIGRQMTAEQRSWAMGITAAAGSFGQFLMVPVSASLIQSIDWSAALLVLAAMALLIGPLALGLREAPPGAAGPSGSMAAAPTGALAALREAFGHRDYVLLTLGYFVCGFQLAFIGVHLPSYLKDNALPPQAATTALALIGLFNVLGTYAAGTLGQRWRKNWILSAIYIGRSVAMLLFVMTPLSTWSVAIFAAVMGALWLSTVPPTNAIVAQMMGVRHLSMLGATVFFSHQIGSFLGVWLGGHLYELSGSYQVVWWLAIALGILAAVVNLPIREHRSPTRALAAL